MAQDNFARVLAMGAEGGGGGVSSYDDLTNKPKINGVELSGEQTGQDLELYNVINSSNHTLISGYAVPTLTDEQITSAYNYVVAGKHVVVNDAYDLIYISVEEATNTDGIAIKVLFRDVLVLTYKLGGVIEAAPIKNVMEVDVLPTENIIDMVYYHLSTDDSYNIHFNSEWYKKVLYQYEWNDNSTTLELHDSKGV